MKAAQKAEQRKIAKELGIDPSDLSLKPKEKDMGQDPRSKQQRLASQLQAKLYPDSDLD